MDQATRTLIERHNRYAREQIVRDLDTLEQKLNVKRQAGNLAGDAIDKVKGTLGMNHRHGSRGLVGFLRDNVVPLAAVGFGGALLARNARENFAHDEAHPGTDRYGTATWDESSALDRSAMSRIEDKEADMGGRVDEARAMVSEKSEEVRAKVSDATDRVKHGVGDAVSSARDRADSMRSDVTERAGEAKQAVVEKVPSRQEAAHMARENAPLLGALALGAGAMAGAFLPRTKYERERLAPLQEQAKEYVSDGVERAKDAVEAGADAAKDAAKQELEGEEQQPSVTTPNRITGGAAGQSSQQVRPEGTRTV